METFASLPELEKLSLRRCPLTGLVLKAPKLRVLEILDSCSVIQEISAPLLTLFRYQGFSPLECLNMNLPLLEQVYVDIYGFDDNVKELHRMLQQLGNATTVLELDGGPIEQSPPPFPNLKCLKVMKGRYKIRTVRQNIMNYLTIGTLYFETLKVEFPDGVTVVKMIEAKGCPTPRCQVVNSSSETMEEDRISQLPNEILQHILSFIDTYEAVETSILSKRWKYLWRSLPSLRLHLNLVVSSDFVSHFLSHRDPTAAVHDFHLSLDTTIQLNLDTAFVEECVLYAINHGVQYLRLNMLRHNEPFLGLPALLLASETLRELELRQLHFMWIYLPGRLSLPNLKTLYLERVLLFDDHCSRDYVMEPFTGLPELEKLYLCEYPIIGLVLRAPKLRVLEIVQYSFELLKVVEEISAPLLTSFRYEGHLPLECSKMNLPMLEKVYLDIHHISYHVKGMHLNCVRMLQQLGHATIVSLTLDIVSLTLDSQGS
ncbi:F-box/FBD/LRR-repeat protein At3g26920-like [Salvia hispanica]|uniref:F-box/FBD/LRR-repeat protein At3g26920-like n=1 Tax=Salvia hispanica TaxID=49212 RepID=UPI002008F428|nr:F-box/FBD/LRR-repeat protein At3g26920-like [Salvia hispanica]